VVKVTADDLLEASNKECIVCLDVQKLGTQSCKLPCGHLFHKPCITEWLEKHCTCPVCRFELETDDPAFEKERRKRMKSRKLRLRVDELKAKSIGQLREFCRTIGVNIEGCIDKSEVIDRVVRSGLVNITEGVPQIQMTEEDFNSKNVAELRHYLLSYGLSDEGALEKSELRTRLLNSDRVALISSSSPSFAQEIPPSNSSSSGNTNAFTVSMLRHMTLSELRKLCVECNISTTGCIDKEEVVQRVAQSGSSKVHILPEEDTVYPSNSSSGEYSSTSERQNHSKCSADSSSSSSYSNVYPRENDNASHSSSSNSHHHQLNNQNAMQLSRQLLADFSIRELKELMKAHGIDTENCLYRSDMIDRLADCSTIHVVD